MDSNALRKWLAQPRTALENAVTNGIREHVASLKSRGIEFYGYALLPGEPYEISSLMAVTNSDADITVPRTDDMFQYYRYAVDEWKNWEHEGFTEANSMLAVLNQNFKSLHSKAPDIFMMDEFEIAHSKALLEAIVRGMEAARSGNVFGISNPFLVVWFSDSSHPIMADSIKRLNSKTVANEAMTTFGWS